MRDALAGAISARWPGVEISQAESFDQAWALAGDGPDLCLVDLVMPGASPLEGVTTLLRAAPDARMMVVTGTHDDGILLDLLGRGVHGFLPKTSAGDVILAAVELVLAGGMYLPPRVAELALTRAGTGSGLLPLTRAPTERAREVLARIAQGQSNKEIARALGVSPSTVKTHVANALASIGAVNRTEAAMRAREMGLI